MENRKKFTKNRKSEKIHEKTKNSPKIENPKKFMEKQRKIEKIHGKSKIVKNFT